MKVQATNIADLLVIEPLVFEDARGYFFEAYNAEKFKKNGIDIVFVQDNQSYSKYGTLRGLHYQNPPHAQTKLVRVLQGRIMDVAVDLRKGSATYGKHFGLELSSENKKQLLVPKGFAHGFAVLSETAVVMYKCDDFYNKAAEGGIKFNDSSLKIDWGMDIKDAIVSDKDIILPDFNNCNSLF